MSYFQKGSCGGTNSIILYRVAPLRELLTHFRFLLTLRSSEGQYHSLILFRLTPTGNGPQNTLSDGDGDRKEIERQLYAMEAQCPHLGADISHAEIEECETSLVLVCPWHRYCILTLHRNTHSILIHFYFPLQRRYDFDLRTGHSETGLKACTYVVQLRQSESNPEEDVVWVEAPDSGTDWRLVELRPVSEGQHTQWYRYHLLNRPDTQNSRIHRHRLSTFHTYPYHLVRKRRQTHHPSP